MELCQYRDGGSSKKVAGQILPKTQKNIKNWWFSNRKLSKTSEADTPIGSAGSVAFAKQVFGEIGINATKRSRKY